MKYVTENLAQALYERRTNEGADWSGYKVRYTYQGDSLSDYESTCIVKAKDEKSAIKIAMQKVNADAARNFRIDGIIDSYFAYKKNYPHSNLKVFEGTTTAVESVDEEFIIEGTNFKVPKRDIQKMTEYFNKGSNPKTLANTVKDADKAKSRYYIATATGWEDCAKEFYRRCKELGVSEADLKQIHDKAASDKGIDIGSVQAVKTTTSSSSTVSSKPARKVISATDDTGFVPASGVPFESAIEVNESNENGVIISKCVKGLSDKDIKNILSYVKGDVQEKNTINLNDKVFKGLVVDIVRGADTRNPVTSYDIEIKSNKNNPWNREWTPILKKSGASKYTNGWMLTGYKSKSDADKDYERIQYNLKNMKFDDDDDDDWG